VFDLSQLDAMTVAQHKSHYLLRQNQADRGKHCSSPLYLEALSGVVAAPAQAQDGVRVLWLAFPKSALFALTRPCPLAAASAWPVRGIAERCLCTQRP
jgi:hypothetical protein